MIGALKAKPGRKPRVCRFVFDNKNQAGVRLGLEVEFCPHKSFEDEQKTRQTKVLSRARANRLIDEQQVQRDIEAIGTAGVASLIHKIEGAERGQPFTVRHLAALVELDVPSVARFGGLDAALPFDANDASPISDEDRARLGLPAKESKNSPQTYGDVARQGIYELVEAVPSLRDWVVQVALDPSCFQDDLEEELKNFGSGAGSPAAA